MIRKMLGSYIGRLKDTEYKIDRRIGSSDLAAFILGKGLALIRGFIRLRKRVFIGRNCRFSYTRMLNISPNTTIGDYTEINCLSTQGVRIGAGVTLGRFGKIRATATLVEIGVGVDIRDYVGLGDGFYLGAFGGITIGEGTIVGERLTIHSDNHKFEDEDVPIRRQGVVALPVEIGKNCWLGSNVTILGGVHIGDGCVIGAGAIVTKSIPDDSLAIGNPARVLRKRTQ